TESPGKVNAKSIGPGSPTFRAAQAIGRAKQTVENRLYTCLSVGLPRGKTSVWMVDVGFVNHGGVHPCEATSQSGRIGHVLAVGEKFRRRFRRWRPGGGD